MADNLDLSIIIVSYNTKDFLLACIESIIKTIKKISYEIIVVDNNSQDHTQEELKVLFCKSELKLVENKKNLGFSKANNLGVRIAKGRYLLFLNPDILVGEKTLDGMVKFMDQKKDAGASTCFVRLPDGSLDDASHRGFPTPWRAFCHFSGLSKIFPKSRLFGGYNLGYLDLSFSHQIDACAGAFLLVRKEAGEKINWWDEDYFWYGEDLDFCYRLKNKGWKIYFVPEFEILHYKGVSGGIKKISEDISTADTKTRNKSIDSRFEAMRIFYKKHYMKKYPFILTWLVMLAINMKWLLTKYNKTL